jgi:hypothetical protein
MNIVEATRSYEDWLGSEVALVKRDLKAKHDLMQGDPFGFLRATYYRWLQQSAKVLDATTAGPRVLGVGDLHLENFGTWRDGEGRLAWGINDFDEAHALPYTHDLVRLAASALIAIDAAQLYVGARRACREILTGYAEAMAAELAKPFVLEGQNTTLRDIAYSDRREPAKFWKGLQALRAVQPPEDVRALLLANLPAGSPEVSFRRRMAGAGSLGLPRYVALRERDRSPVAREAKARVPGALVWLGAKPAKTDSYAAILNHTVRPHDPFIVLTPRWLVRRLGPHCERIELADIAVAAERREVLRAMGTETANIHRSTKGAAAAIRAHLNRQPDNWLYDAASRMAETVHRDWKVWRRKS